ncbi:MAG: hypothetical protein QOF31_4729, partial [Mycobacterium sp.]|nr:hypothetical protein [Mycobacterium sp.]
MRLADKTRCLGQLLGGVSNSVRLLAAVTVAVSQ